MPREEALRWRPSRSPTDRRLVRQVSWLPDRPLSGPFPDARPIPRSLTSSGIVPNASPVTVAGAARDFHPLPMNRTKR